MHSHHRIAQVRFKLPLCILPFVEPIETSDAFTYEFLKTEYQEYHNQYRHLDGLQTKYVEFFVILVVAVLSVLGALLQFDKLFEGTPLDWSIISFCAFFGLLCLGIGILWISVHIRDTQLRIAQYLWEIAFFVYGKASRDVRRVLEFRELAHEAIGKDGFKLEKREKMEASVWGAWTRGRPGKLMKILMGILVPLLLVSMLMGVRLVGIYLVSPAFDLLELDSFPVLAGIALPFGILSIYGIWRLIIRRKKRETENHYSLKWKRLAETKGRQSDSYHDEK